MDQELKNKINEKMQAIPEKYREVINSFGWEKILEDIGKDNDLFYDQIEDLYIETFLVMLGLTNPTDFVSELEDRLLIERIEAEKIASEVDMELLRPLREKLIEKFPEMEDGDDLEDEAEIRNSLENPPASKPISFIEKQMNAPHALGNKKPAPVPMPPGEKYSDPYREIF